MKKQFTLILMLLTVLLFQACKPEVIEPEPEPEPLTLLEKLQGRWRLDSLQDTHGPTVFPDTLTWYRISGNMIEYSFLPGQLFQIEVRTTNQIDSLLANPPQTSSSYRIDHLDTEKSIWYQRTMDPFYERYATRYFSKTK